MMISHLLPNARAWRVVIEKQLRQFFVGLSGVEVDVTEFFDEVYGDLFPGTTRGVSAWEEQFGLRQVSMFESVRRARLAAAWSALGGQSPRYIQDTLQANGFDVYVHESWVPGTEPAIGSHAPATYRSPIMWLRSSTSDNYPAVDCGEALAECGEAFAEAGNGVEPLGYPLVNNIQNVDYAVPVDPTKWPYFIYIGAETFGVMTTVATNRKDEFEALCLKICPTQNWLGMLVEYS